MAQNDTGKESFHSILNEKLGKPASFDETPRSSANKNSSFSSESTAQGLWEKLTDLGLGQLNLKPTATYPKSKPLEKPKDKVVWKPVGLSKDMTMAFEFFHKYGAFVTDKSTTSEIKRAYRQLAKALHPDRYAQASELEQKQQSKLFRELHTHYSVLSKPSIKAA